MMTPNNLELTTRRGFIKRVATGGAGLLLATWLPLRTRAEHRVPATIKGPAGEATYAPNAFLRIAPDDTVTVLVKHIEFGQGPFTGLATLVAEELDADWSQMRAEAAPANVGLYKNLAFGVQGTGGSTAIANSYEQMRMVGASARAMLIEAAAREWRVPANEISVSKGVIKHAKSGKQAGYGQFAEAAAKQNVPTGVKLKDPKDFRLIGSDLPKLDSVDKSRGTATFTLDVQKPDMLTVVVAHPPRFGATVKSFDASKALKIRGVVDIKAIPEGVAVYAKSFWPAKKARDLVEINWNEANAEKRSSANIIKIYQQQAKIPGNSADKSGDTAAAFSKAEKHLEAEYVFPYLAHAPMEPLDCVIQLGDGEAEAWFGSQLQTIDQGGIAKVLGIQPDKVKINTLIAGGSFGRRAQAGGDFAVEAARAAKSLGRKVPVKLVWTREDDIKGGRYRPIYVHRLKGALDKSGNVIAWDHTIIGQSIMAGGPFASQIKNGIDPSSVEGARELPYAIANRQLSLHTTELGIPILWWRSVGSTHTGYSVETFLDELLEAADRDPVLGRIALLRDHPRHIGVLKAVAELADWGSNVPEGRARGVAVHKSFGSYVAQIAEVSKSDEGIPKAHKVWCAVDCGVAVNPNVITAQMEGGIGYGLGAALFNEITLEDGKVAQSNFHDYRSLRINEMPAVEVRVIKSAEKPTGVGEPGVPPIAPAVANAWAKLTGQRVRRLPFTSASA